jgi:hypothetical protein
MNEFNATVKPIVDEGKGSIGPVGQSEGEYPFTVLHNLSTYFM